jgi:ankyrin repeat protein
MDGTGVDGDGRRQWQKALILGFFVLPIVLTIVLMLSPAFRQLRERNRLQNEQLLAAVEQGDKARVEQLLRAGASVNASTPSGLTALTLAITRGQDEVALLLMAHGASLDARDRTGYLREMNPGNSPAYYAAIYGRTRVLKAMLERGVSPNQRDRNGRTLLMLAAENGHRDTVRMLLASGADPNARSVSGETVLEAARRSHDPEIVALIQQAIQR